MKAALMQHGNIWVDEIETPQPAPGEILVKTLACGICGSDLHAAEHNQQFVETSRATGGAFKLTTFDPVALGHEFCAEVVEYGPETERKLAPGSHVCAVPMLVRNPPQAIGYSVAAPGGFAEFMLVSERLTFAVPEGTPFTASALTEPMAVGLHAVRKARLAGDEAAIVLGCGPVGLAVITALKAAGIAPIVAADFSSGRREFALQQGADVVIDPADQPPFASDELVNRPDIVTFECVGVPGVLDDIFVHAPQNGRIVVVGVCLQTDHIRPLVAINKELNIQFVLGYSVDEFVESLHYIAEGKFDVSGLVTAETSLAGVARAFEDLRSPDQHAKILVEPWKSV